jgi:hypothetical protein
MGTLWPGIGDPGRHPSDYPREAGSPIPATAKKPHPIPPRHAFNTQMKKKDDDISRRRRVTDYSVAAIEQTESYCRAHQGSSTAVRRPQLFFRGELWIAVLGPSVEEGIVGIGPTVAAALRAFDAQYLAGLGVAVETASQDGAMRRSPKAFGTARRSCRSPKSALKSRGAISSFAWPS